MEEINFKKISKTKKRKLLFLKKKDGDTKKNKVEMITILKDLQCLERSQDFLSIFNKLDVLFCIQSALFILINDKEYIYWDEVYDDKLFVSTTKKFIETHYDKIKCITLEDIQNNDYFKNNKHFEGDDPQNYFDEIANLKNIVIDNIKEDRKNAFYIIFLLLKCIPKINLDENFIKLEEKFKNFLIYNENKEINLADKYYCIQTIRKKFNNMSSDFETALKAFTTMKQSDKFFENVDNRVYFENKYIITPTNLYLTSVVFHRRNSNALNKLQFDLKSTNLHKFLARVFCDQLDFIKFPYLIFNNTTDDRIIVLFYNKNLKDKDYDNLPRLQDSYSKVYTFINDYDMYGNNIIEARVIKSFIWHGMTQKDIVRYKEALKDRNCSPQYLDTFKNKFFKLEEPLDMNQSKFINHYVHSVMPSFLNTQLEYNTLLKIFGIYSMEHKNQASALLYSLVNLIVSKTDDESEKLQEGVTTISCLNNCYVISPKNHFNLSIYKHIILPYCGIGKDFFFLMNNKSTLLEDHKKILETQKNKTKIEVFEKQKDLWFDFLEQI